MLSVPPEKRRAVARQWLAAAVKEYPPSTANLLLREEDPFRNPVGAALKEGIPRLVEELFGGMDRHEVSQALEGIVRVRAIQDLTPRQAVGFVFELRTILRELLPANSEDAGELEHRIDEMALAAFDLYMRCREQVYEVRHSEARRREGVLERMYSRDEGG
jgi:RsbT co-antagonist protein rsbRD N-terminal domain